MFSLAIANYDYEHYEGDGVCTICGEYIDDHTDSMDRACRTQYIKKHPDRSKRYV